VAKYRCDAKILDRADLARLTLPHRRGSISIALRRPGVSELDYCGRYPGDEPVNPGNRVAITPIEPTLALALTSPP
jgi:hypothetical protein